MTTTPAIPRPRTPSEARHNSPPRAASVLAVTARPGQESADLGGLLYAFRLAATRLRRSRRTALPAADARCCRARRR